MHGHTAQGRVGITACSGREHQTDLIRFRFLQAAVGQGHADLRPQPTAGLWHWDNVAQLAIHSSGRQVAMGMWCK
jgi:hypothetical protein